MRDSEARSTAAGPMPTVPGQALEPSASRTVGAGRLIDGAAEAIRCSSVVTGVSCAVPRNRRYMGLGSFSVRFGPDPLSEGDHSVRRILAATAATLCLAVPSGSPAWADGAEDAAKAEESAKAKDPKVLMIGLDGARYDKLLAGDTPNFHKLKEQGYSSKSTLPGSSSAPTVSGPGWATALTGVWPEKHKVLDNNFTGNDIDSWPTWLQRAETQKPQLDTFSALDWEPIETHLLRGAADTAKVHSEAGGFDQADEKVTSDAERHLREVGPGAADASFVYLGHPDEAGHASGAESPEYAKALQKADARIGRMLNAVHARESYADEDWLVLVTTDHGHTASGGHGGDSPEERMTFVTGTGGGLPAGTPDKEPDLVDVAPTVLHHLGVGGEGLDGTPLN